VKKIKSKAMEDGGIVGRPNGRMVAWRDNSVNDLKIARSWVQALVMLNTHLENELLT